MNRRIRYTSAVLFSMVVTAPVHASLTNPATIGMSLFGFQFSGQRNYLGNGTTINANAFYNNRTFNFGFADLTLNGSLALQADITRRGIPTVGFSANSGGAPLSYVFNMNNGIQNTVASGSELININSKINALGFYTSTVQISNRGTYATQGLGVVDSGSLDFDAGPYNVSGNIFADALATITEPFFAATGTINPFSKFSGKSQKAIEASKTAEGLRARIDAGEVLSDEEMSSLVNNTVLAAMLGGQPDSKLLDNVLIPAGLLQQTKDVSEVSLKGVADAVPEPASVLLITIALPLVYRPRRSARTA